jgi:hypothetical protein
MLISVENSDMKPRHVLARIAGVVTAAAAIGMFLGRSAPMRPTTTTRMARSTGT